MLATLHGSSTIVVRDVTNPDAALTLCSFGSFGLDWPRSMGFLDPSDVVYQVDDGIHASSALYRANLKNGATSLVLATQTAGVLGWGIRSDGSLTYLTEGVSLIEWHLKSAGSDRLLASWPFLGGRGANPYDSDSVWVAFSPDGRYVGLVTTFISGQDLRGPQAPFQIRNMAGDLVDAYPAQDSPITAGAYAFRTMAMWSRTGATLYYRDTQGVWRWNGPGATQLVLPSVPWTHPSTDVSGDWIAYAAAGSDGRHRVSVWNVAGNATPTVITGYGRTSPTFIESGLLFYTGEQPCQTECAFYPSDDGYLYSVPGGAELASRLGSVLATWAG